jgi:hypothetical protein
MVVATPPHPVWTVYNEIRTARLNIKYLQRKIRSLRNVNLIYEITLAVATSSAVAGFSFWQDATGKAIWAAIGVVATLLAVVKPILQLSDVLRGKQELLASYMILDHDLNTIRGEIQFKGKYDDALKRQFLRALERKAELVKKDTGSGVNERLRHRCFEEVLRELPSESFYIPPEK